jgi:hypothetical protein
MGFSSCLYSPVTVTLLQLPPGGGHLSQWAEWHRVLTLLWAASPCPLKAEQKKKPGLVQILAAWLHFNCEIEFQIFFCLFKKFPPFLVELILVELEAPGQITSSVSAPRSSNLLTHSPFLPLQNSISRTSRLSLPTSFSFVALGFELRTSHLLIRPANTWGTKPTLFILCISAWPWTVILLISASWIASITSVSHLCPARL